MADLCARLPYGVTVHCEWNLFQGDRISEDGELVSINIQADSIYFKRNSGKITEIPFNRIDGIVLPYLRSMSSMTEEEIVEIHSMGFAYWTTMINNDLRTRGPMSLLDAIITHHKMVKLIDWLNAHHFDYHFPGLIEKGLAKEAPTGMYK